MRKQSNIRKLEEEIKRLRQELDDYKAIANLGHWQLNLTTGNFKFSDEVNKLLEINCSDCDNPYEQKMSIIHPDDKADVKNAIGDILKNQKHGVVEYRVIVRNNTIRYIREWIFVAHDVNGNPIHISGILTDYTAQKLNEIALVSSERKFRGLLNNTSDAVSVTDSKGHIIYGNPSFIKMLGYNNLDDIIDLPASDFMAYNEFKVFYRKLVKGGNIKNYKAELLRKDGRKLYVLISSKIIYAEKVKEPVVESFIKDITESKEAGLKIIRHNKHLERLINITQIKTSGTKELIDLALKEGIELTGSELGFIDLYNPKTGTLTLHAWSGAAMGKSRLFKKQVQLQVEEASIWDEIIRSKKPYIINNFSIESIWGKVVRDIRFGIRKYLLVPVTLDNKIVAITSMVNKKTDYDETDAQQLALLMDTIWKRLEKQKINDDLVKAREKAEEADKLKSAFLANMSHEIRTPLNTIVGFANLLSESGMSTEEMDYHVKLINQGASQLSQIINDIMDISKIETGQVSVKYSTVNIKNLINQTIQLFSTQVEEKKVAITSNLKEEEIIIKTDEHKLQQVVNNLVSNAIKFTAQGEISISAYNKEDDLIIEVKDTGIGIPLQEQGKIFDHFRTGEVDLKKKYSGAGLGLPISKGLIELMNGKIWVESAPGKGSSFYISVPYQKPKKETGRHQPNHNLGLAGRTILIAEDETFNFYFLEKLLKGAEIIHAPNGKRAVELVKENPSIDLILMDIKMPLMDGFEAARIIKGIAPGIPIIAQSAFATSNEINKAKELGFEYYITKPINSNHLMQTIYEALAKVNPPKSKKQIL